MMRAHPAFHVLELRHLEHACVGLGLEARAHVTVGSKRRAGVRTTALKLLNSVQQSVVSQVFNGLVQLGYVLVIALNDTGDRRGRSVRSAESFR